MIIRKQNLKSTISSSNKKLIREKKYMDRLIHDNYTSVHSSDVLTLQHLAWNQMLINANPTTVYCLCHYGPKHTVCIECAKQLFLIKPSTASCICEKIREHQCKSCKQNSSLTLAEKSVEYCME